GRRSRRRRRGRAARPAARDRRDADHAPGPARERARRVPHRGAARRRSHQGGVGTVIDLGLTGKRALVTGAGIGIGRGIARWLASAGCDVLLADRDAGALDDARADVVSEGTAVVTATVDLRDPDRVREMVATAVDQLGGLDVAVNNVG